MRRMKAGRLEKLKKWMSALLLAGILLWSLPGSAVSAFVLQGYAAQAWPSLSQSVHAEAAICMDADTGAILYGKNINAVHYPASITKIMTALLVLENCELSETVTFSESAVSNLEPGAVTAFTSAGDTLTVEDCLYALLFRSANEVANALAEHVAGSVSTFADMMNQRAAELGCTNTHFVNPNGLNHSDHYTTAYDMALIAKACMQNPAFVELEAVDSYKIGGTAKRPDGLTVTLGHKMKRSGTAYSDSRVVAGKTGFTSAAGNTLVTMAEDGGRRIVAVVLKDRNPMHYTDTASMLDLGFSGFENVEAKALFDAKAVEQRLITDGVLPQGEGANSLHTEEKLRVSLPKGGTIDHIRTEYEYNLGQNAPEDAVAKLLLYYDDHTAGEFFILNSRESTLSILDVSTPAKVAIVSLSLASVIGIAAFFLLGGGTVWHVHNVRVEQRRLARMRRRRRRRLESMGMTEAEFRALVEQHRQQENKGAVQTPERRGPGKSAEGAKRTYDAAGKGDARIRGGHRTRQ